VLREVKMDIYTYTSPNSSKSLSKETNTLRPLTAQAYLLGEGTNKGKAYLVDSLLQRYISSFREYSGLQVDKENFYPFYTLSHERIGYPKAQSADGIDYISIQFKGLSPLQSLLVVDGIQSKLLMYHNGFF
jgi:hypothetical protein